MDYENQHFNSQPERFRINAAAIGLLERAGGRFIRSRIVSKPFQKQAMELAKIWIDAHFASLKKRNNNGARILAATQKREIRRHLLDGLRELQGMAPTKADARRVKEAADFIERIEIADDGDLSVSK